ncbi:hypothetical protein [Piscirickettsia salmonis]|nr:hypothetical protein [Piscirickettsia salmonis]APS56914.1 hypothetical protein AVI52_06435 [Piscirickettsia salmonis]ERL63189.1 hypothetical protein K661_00451 [Piscirickettsia salmonis LF-89 = ATCC VR-1361]PEQ16835.1 hypothetical protein X973_05325 [Piscirickettsia salmonis]QGN78283.1 hypothetical protein Psal001_02521 [Piscirickettsia salmonis]QGN81864.1 hypothetical protein Psal002_02537 [Piscirickettsia salmonis]
MTSIIDLEVEKLKVLSEKLGDPYILYGFKNLDKKIDDLYLNKLYRVRTLHKVCDKICESELGDSDDGEGEGEGGSDGKISLYVLLVLLYLINPRRAIPVFIDHLIYQDPAEKLIIKNSEILGIDVREKNNNTDLMLSKSKKPENKPSTRDGSLDYGGWS